MAKNNGRNSVILISLAIAALILFNCMSKKSMFAPAAPVAGAAEPIVGAGARGFAPAAGNGGIDITACSLKNGGRGLASALLPKETAAQENFGNFAPDDVLKGQNFIDPRAQIGFPETVGGALRNANQQVRSEPPNPRAPVSIFNTSTIAPDQMRAQFEIGAPAQA